MKKEPMIMNAAKCLEQIGMTPRELADELGLPRSQISRFIVGEEKPDRLTTWALVGLRAAKKEKTHHNSTASLNEIPKNSLAEELSSDRWAGKTARLAIPVLINLAKNKSTLTYKELHEKIVGIGGSDNIGKMTKYAFPLGRIAKAMERLELPPLTSIVVQGITRLPSSGINGFIERHLELNRDDARALRDDDTFRRELVLKLWDEVFSYPQWEAVMGKLGITGDPKYDA